MTYWSEIGIDMISKIEIFDIPKYSSMSLYITLGITFGLTAVYKLFHYSYYVNKAPVDIERLNRWVKFSNRFMPILTIVTLMIFYMIAKAFPFPVIIKVCIIFAGMFLALSIIYQFYFSSISKQTIPRQEYRFIICCILAITPIVCYFRGYSKGVDVVNNRNIVTFSPISNDGQINHLDSSPVKLLGFFGKKIIVSTLDNKDIYFINEDSYNTIKFSAYTSNKKVTVHPINNVPIDTSSRKSK